NRRVDRVIQHHQMTPFRRQERVAHFVHQQSEIIAGNRAGGARTFAVGKKSGIFWAQTQGSETVPWYLMRFEKRAGVGADSAASGLDAPRLWLGTRVTWQTASRQALAGARGTTQPPISILLQARLLPQRGALPRAR